MFIDYFDKTQTKEDSWPLWVLGLLFLGIHVVTTFLSIFYQIISNNF